MNDLTRKVCVELRYGHNLEDQVAGLDCENAALRTALADAQKERVHCSDAL